MPVAQWLHEPNWKSDLYTAVMLSEKMQLGREKQLHVVRAYIEDGQKCVAVFVVELVHSFAKIVRLEPVEVQHLGDFAVKRALKEKLEPCDIASLAIFLSERPHNLELLLHQFVVEVLHALRLCQTFRMILEVEQSARYFNTLQPAPYTLQRAALLMRLERNSRPTKATETLKTNKYSVSKYKDTLHAFSCAPHASKPDASSPGASS